MIIAIIDDGVNSGYFPEIGKLSFDITIGKNKKAVVRKNYNKKLLSHGTTCAAIVKKYFPKAEIASIKILSPKTQKSTPAQLVEALRICGEKKIKLVNMSIGSCQIKDIPLISEAVQRFQATGGIVVAALTNSMRWSVPACLNKVLSAKVDRTLLNDSFYPNKQGLHDVLFMASSNHTLTNYLGEEIETQICNSYCAPVITATVGKLLFQDKKLSYTAILRGLGIKRPYTYIQRFKNTSFSNNEEIDMPVIEIIGTSPHTLTLANALCALMTSKGYPCIVCGENKSDFPNELGYIPKGVSKHKFIEFHEKLLDLSAMILIDEIYKKSDCRISLSDTAKRIKRNGDDIVLPYDYSESQLNRIIKYFE